MEIYILSFIAVCCVIHALLAFCRLDKDAKINILFSILVVLTLLVIISPPIYIEYRRGMREVSASFYEEIKDLNINVDKEMEDGKINYFELKTIKRRADKQKADQVKKGLVK